MNQPWIYMYSPSWSPLPPPSLPHPSGMTQRDGVEIEFIGTPLYSFLCIFSGCTGTVMASLSCCVGAHIVFGVQIFTLWCIQKKFENRGLKGKGILRRDFCMTKFPTSIGNREGWKIPQSICASLVAQTVKNMPAIQEIRVQSLGWGDPLEKRMATHSNILT